MQGNLQTGNANNWRWNTQQTEADSSSSELKEQVKANKKVFFVFLNSAFFIIIVITVLYMKYMYYIATTPPLNMMDSYSLGTRSQ